MGGGDLKIALNPPRTLGKAQISSWQDLNVQPKK